MAVLLGLRVGVAGRWRGLRRLRGGPGPQASTAARWRRPSSGSCATASWSRPEDSLAEMRAKGAAYLVGTPKGWLTKLEQAFRAQRWARVRERVQVKRLSLKRPRYLGRPSPEAV